MPSPPVSRWVEFVSGPPATGPELTLFLFPYAGAGTGVLRSWAAALSDVCAVALIHPPGREDRLAEPPEIEVSDLVDGILEAARAAPFALYGHSFGARLAFEASRALRSLGIRDQRLLAVSGCPAPQLPVPHREDSDLSDADLIARVRKLGAPNDELLGDDEFIDVILPALRADFAFVDGYEYVPEPPLEAKIWASYGTADTEADGASVRAWCAQGADSCTVTAFDGNHSFIHTDRTFLPKLREAVRSARD